MPLPNITVPAFPNVPNVPGVPPLVRSALASANSFAGTLTGSLDPRTSVFTGQLSGILTQATGQAGAIIGTVRGVLDSANNFTATLSGVVGGNLVGTLTGLVDRATGVIRATVAAAVTQINGVLGVLTGDSLSLLTQAEPFKWGIFSSTGAPVIVGDNVKALDFNRDFRIVDYPVEKGTFESYNKVETPLEVRVTFTKGGSVAERADFLAACDIALSSLDLVSVATPEMTYTEMNVVHVGGDRNHESGANLLTVEVGLQRVRATAVTAFTAGQTKTPSGAGDKNAGPVQAVDPTDTQTRAVAASAQTEGDPI